MENQRSGLERAESGIKVLDRAVTILNAIAQKPRTLAELAKETELPRATAHRLASALETHGMLTRTKDSRWSIGATLARLGSQGADTLINIAVPIMEDLVDHTGESVQLYRLSGNSRICIASQEPASGLRNTVPVGTRLPLTAGSAARVFAAYSPAPISDAFPEKDLAEIRERRLAESVAEREVGLASLSSPVLDPGGNVVAVLSISGAAERLKPHPADIWGKELVDAAQKLGSLL